MAISVPALLDSAQTYASAADSSNEAINLLQIVDASHAYTSGYTRRNYYDSAGQLPTADSSMEGMITLVKGTQAGGLGNGLYLCTGTAWTEFYDLDSGDYIDPFSLQGSTSGFVAGGHYTFATALNSIGTYSFGSSVTLSDHGDLISASAYSAPSNDASYGYVHGGVRTAPVPNPSVDRFSFSSSTGGTNVGSLSFSYYYAAGFSSPSSYGYNVGGQGQTIIPSFPSTYGNSIQKFPLTSSTTSTDIGDLVVNVHRQIANNSTEYGYNSGGTASPWSPSPTAFSAPTLGPSGPSWGPGSYGTNDASPGTTDFFVAVRDKFPFASDTNSSWIANLNPFRSSGTGVNSSDKGFFFTGYQRTSPWIGINALQHFPFASDTTITSNGLLQTVNTYPAVYVEGSGSSSTDYGYIHGSRGTASYPAITSDIIRFPWSATGGGETDVGDITSGYGRINATGHQV